MRRIGVFMLAAVAVSPPASAHTDFFTGDQLERMCSGGAVDHGWCGGYVAAIASSFDCRPNRPEVDFAIAHHAPA